MKIFTNEKFDAMVMSRVILTTTIFISVVILGTASFYYAQSFKSATNVLVHNNIINKGMPKEVTMSISKKIINKPEYFNPIIRVEIGSNFWSIDTAILRNISISIYLKYQNEAKTMLERMGQKIYYTQNGKIVFIYPTNSNLRPLEMALPMRIIERNLAKNEL